MEINCKALTACNMAPSGWSSRNSNAAVSFSINDFLMYNSKKVTRHNKTNSSLLSAANIDLVSWNCDGAVT